MKNNSYAYGKCFTCAKKITEDKAKTVHILSALIACYRVKRMYCEEHIESAVMRRYFEERHRTLVLAERVSEMFRQFSYIDPCKKPFNAKDIGFEDYCKRIIRDIKRTLRLSWPQRAVDYIKLVVRSVIRKIKRPKEITVTITIDNPLGNIDWDVFSDDIIDAINRAGKRNKK